MSSKIDILGVKIDNLTMNEALKRIGQFLKSNKPRTRTSSVRGRQHYIVLPYSEFIVRAQKDEEFKKILNQADLSLADGVGIRWVAKFLEGKEKRRKTHDIMLYNIISLLEGLIRFVLSGASLVFYPKYCKRALPERIKGADLICKLNGKLFLLGGKEGVVEKVRKKLNAKVVGAEHGYQNLEKVIEKINRAKPDILLVGLGSPKQEKWIYKNLRKIPSVKLAIGVGGAFDFISGRIKRAPKFFQKIGLEWLWRLILQPWRIKRIYNGVIKLSWLALKTKIKSPVNKFDRA